MATIDDTPPPANSFKRASCGRRSQHRAKGSASAQLKTIQLHDLRPCCDEVSDELRLRVGAAIDLGQSAQLRVRSEDKIDTRSGPAQCAGLTVPTLERTAVARERLPLDAHVEQVDEEVVGQRPRALREGAVLRGANVGA